MKTLIQKLNSKRGVSIVMALLLALICLFAGAAALTAASSNIGRYSYLRQDQQEYLSISSAARLLKTQFEQGSNNITADCSGGVTANITLNSTINSNHVYALLHDWLSNLLFNAYIQSMPPNPSNPSPHTLPVKKFTVEATDFDTVHVNVSANNIEPTKADIDVELYVLEDGKPDELQYRKRTLKFTVNLTLNPDVGSKTITVATAKVERITLPGE